MFLASGLGFTATMCLLFWFFYVLCHRITWQSGNVFYLLLKMAEFGAAPFLFLLGWAYLIYRFYFREPRAAQGQDALIQRLCRRTILLLFLSIVLWLLLMAGIVVGISYILDQDFIWNGNASAARLLNAVTSMVPFLGLAGILLIPVLVFQRPFAYLREMIRAAEQMWQEPEKPVTLSAPLKRIQDELNQLRETSVLNALAAKEAEQRKQDLIVYLAHDLKTPLTSVIGYMTLLRDEPEISPELRAKYTGIAVEKALRLEELINEFFEITRFQLTHMELEKETINFSRMLEQTAFEFRPVLAEKQLHWNLEIAPDVMLLCDPDKIERVMDNLIRNAISYSYAGTTVSLTLKTTETSAVCCLSNTGKTIPPEKLSRIFEQFFRADTSRATSTGGAGLGLAIAKQITELHGGTIQAESRDETIRFTVTLPLRQKIVRNSAEN